MNEIFPKNKKNLRAWGTFKINSEFRSKERKIFMPVNKVKMRFFKFDDA